MAYNKIVYGGKTLIDLTADTIEPAKILMGYTAHDRSGAPITGSCTFDSDTSDATAKEGEILFGKTAYINGEKVIGTMPNRGSVNYDITTKAGVYTIPLGFSDGTGKVKISEDEQAKIIAQNIKQGIVILGVTGSLRPASDIKAQVKTVTPSLDQNVVVTADPTYDYLSQVTVNKVPYKEEENAAGGITVTIG